MKKKKQNPLKGNKRNPVPAKTLAEIKVLQDDEEKKIDRFPPEVLARALRKMIEDDDPS
jgi:hypothetical protein